MPVTDGALSAGGGTAGGGAEVASAIGTAGRRVLGLEDGRLLIVGWPA